MPTIVDPPGPPGIEANFHETVRLRQPYSVAAGTIYFTTTLELMYTREDYTETFEYIPTHVTTFVNHGALWNRAHGYHGTVISTQNLGHITNTGLIVSEAPAGEGQALAIWVRGAFHGLDNKGRIYAISYDGPAVALVDHGGSGTYVVNSGLIAALRAGTPGDFPFFAIAIDRYNGGNVVNTESGAILAEGPRASGVRLWHGHINPPGWADEPDIENYGRIEAAATDSRYESVAIWFENFGFERASVVNAGTIKADIAILFLGWGDIGDDQKPKSVANLAGGLIDGDIVLSAFSETIVNGGTIDGGVYADAGEDFVRNAGRVTGVVDLGAGRDFYEGGAALGAADVRGGAGVDLIVGGGGGDRLEGGDGDDWIVGAGGADLLIGGAGADRFVIAAAGDSSPDAPDTIQAFESGSDRIDLSAIAPSAVDLSVSGGVTTIAAQTAQGAAVIRVEGAVALSDLILAPPGAIRTGTAAADVLHAGAGAAELRGAGGEDLLVGSPGDDVLDGGEGADVMRGGAGDDLYFVDHNDIYQSKADRVFELEGEGLDEVRTSVAYQLPDAVENLTFIGASGIRVEGNGADNVMRGNDGDNILDGAAGDDILIGGGGRDELAGSMGADRFVYEAVSDSTAAASDRLIAFESGIDRIDLTALAVTSISWTEYYHYDGISAHQYQLVTVQTPGGALTLRVMGTVAMSDFLTAQTVIQGTDGDDDLTGTPEPDEMSGKGGNDRLSGLGGDDDLRGGPGDDRLDGGGGDDRMAGGAGDDFYEVDSAADRVEEQSGEGTDEIRTGLFAYSLAGIGHVENLTGTSAAGQSLTGNGLGNRIAGGDGSDVIDGAGGADIMTGGAGDDVYHVDHPGDAVTDEAGIDEVRTGLGAYALGALSLVENLTGTSSGGQALTGNELANRIAGGAGDDRIDGGGGADELGGGGGDDVYFVDAGDTIVESAGAGTDEVRTALAAFALGTNVEMLSGTSGSGQSLTGNDLANRIAGGAGNDVLDGRIGADAMHGGAGDDLYFADDSGDTTVEQAGGGNDEVRASASSYALAENVETLVGTSNAGQLLSGNFQANVIRAGAGDDTIYAGGGNDALSGGAGRDGIYAGVGDDTIDGGAGPDYMVGQAGDDLYLVDDAADEAIEAAGEGTDEVRTAISFTLGANVENLTGTGSTGQTLTGNGGDNRIVGGTGDDVLNGGTGNDFLFGHIGADVVAGGLGDDVYLIDAADTIVEHFGEGTDEVRTVGTIFVLGAGLDNLRGLNDGGHDFRGNAGPNALIGAGGNDILRMQDGGDDLAFGKGGVDGFYFGAAFDQYDLADGGDNRDSLILQGNYSLTLRFAPTGGSSIVNVESISLVSGANASFGDTANRRYSYDLTMIDANVAPGALMKVNGANLLAGEDFTLDASDEKDAPLQIFGGLGLDRLTGGQQGDAFVFGEGRFAAGDSVTGGGGYDVLYLRGDYVIDFNAAGFAGALAGVESIALLTSANTEFLAGGDGDFDYTITWNDAMLGAGGTMTANGGRLQAHETFVFNGASESDGHLRVFGGAGGDTLTTGGGNDQIHGGAGADVLTGGAGADLYRYFSAGDSTASATDTIKGFVSGQDRIDLTHIDAVAATEANDGFTFIGSAPFTAAGQLRAVNVAADVWQIEGDTNGDGIADFVIRLEQTPLVAAADFML